MVTSTDESSWDILEDPHYRRHHSRPSAEPFPTTTTTISSNPYDHVITPSNPFDDVTSLPLDHVTVTRGGQDFSNDDPLLRTLREQEARLSVMMSQFSAQLNLATSSDTSHSARPTPTDLLDDYSINPYPLLSPISSVAGPHSPFYSTDNASVLSGTSSAGPPIIFLPHEPRERAPYAPPFFSTSIPIRIQFLGRHLHCRQGQLGHTTRWHLRFVESYPGAFAEWQTLFTPNGDYTFEDHRNSLLVLAQRPDHKPMLLCFPVATSPAWAHQGLGPNPPFLHALRPCELPCFPARGPRIGGNLHPGFYGAPGDALTNRASRQPLYLPTTTFLGDGIPVASSYAAA
jgi:hypothetical protein